MQVVQELLEDLWSTSLYSRSSDGVVSGVLQYTNHIVERTLTLVQTTVL